MAPIPINIADWVGRTPMVQLTRLLPDAPRLAREMNEHLFAKRYIAKRLDALADEVERGWTGRFTEGQGFLFEARPGAAPQQAIGRVGAPVGEHVRLPLPHRPLRVAAQLAHPAIVPIYDRSTLIRSASFAGTWQSRYQRPWRTTSAHGSTSATHSEPASER